MATGGRARAVEPLIRAGLEVETVDEVVLSTSIGYVQVATADPQTLRRLLADAGASVDTKPDGALIVTGMHARDIGIMAGSAGITLHELSPRNASAP